MYEMMHASTRGDEPRGAKVAERRERRHFEACRGRGRMPAVAQSRQARAGELGRARGQLWVENPFFEKLPPGGRK